MFIPQLGKYAESILENGSSSGRKLATLQAIGRQAVAALCALGGFKETIKIGSEVQVSARIEPSLSLSLVVVPFSASFLLFPFFRVAFFCVLFCRSSPCLLSHFIIPQFLYV